MKPVLQNEVPPNNVKVSEHKVSSFAAPAFRCLLPGAALLLIPKCPLCIMAYVAMISGIGLSVSTASGVRYALIAVSLSAMVYFVARFLLNIGDRRV